MCHTGTSARRMKPASTGIRPPEPAPPAGQPLLADKVDQGQATVYRESAVRILESLYRNYGTWDNDGEEGLILHGTSHYPEGRNIDVPLIYGDFSLWKAARLRGKGPFYWE